MRLSEAIRLGALISSRAVGAFVDGNQACALGAAMLATGTGTSTDLLMLMGRWPWAVDHSARCPACDLVSSVLELVIHLNDDHCLSREDIGRWVGTVEPQTTVEPEPTVEPQTMRTVHSDDDAEGVLESVR